MAGANGSDVHSSMGNKTLLKSDALYEYILKTMVRPREHDCLQELELISNQHPRAYMASAPDEVQFLAMLVKMLGAKNTIEVGVFTGYSLLATALSLPDDGKIVAIDYKREAYDLGLPVIRKAGVEHKIDFREGPALSILDQLLSEEENKGKFDFAFIDADKVNYLNYHEHMVQLVRVGGLIVYDNTLWGGTVAAAHGEQLSQIDLKNSAALRTLNSKIAADPRVEVCLLSIADGVTLCRRVI